MLAHHEPRRCQIAIRRTLRRFATDIADIVLSLSLRRAYKPQTIPTNTLLEQRSALGSRQRGGHARVVVGVAQATEEAQHLHAHDADMIILAFCFLTVSIT